MKFSKGNLPLYFQFYLQIKQDIIIGELRPGSRIPGIEELYKTHNISQGTVRKALELLEFEGLITKKQRLGTFVKEDIDLRLQNTGNTREEFKSVFQMQKYEHLSSEWVQIPNRVQTIFSEAHKKNAFFRISRSQILQRSERDKGNRPSLVLR